MLTECLIVFLEFVYGEDVSNINTRINAQCDISLGARRNDFVNDDIPGVCQIE